MVRGKVVRVVDSPGIVINLAMSIQQTDLGSVTGERMTMVVVVAMVMIVTMMMMVMVVVLMMIVTMMMMMMMMIMMSMVRGFVVSVVVSLQV